MPYIFAILDDSFIRLVKKVRLSSLGVDVRMCTEEWEESSELVPSHEHLRFWVSEETTNIGYRELLADQCYWVIRIRI